MTEKDKAIKHFESLQKRYTTLHNGVQCELVKTALEALREYAERQDPKPLTKSQVGDRIHQHKPIYIKSLNPEYNSAWKIPDGMDKDKSKNPRLYFCDDSWIPLSAWGKDYEIYDFEPRKDTK